VPSWFQSVKSYRRQHEKSVINDSKKKEPQLKQPPSENFDSYATLQAPKPSIAYDTPKTAVIKLS